MKKLIIAFIVLGFIVLIGIYFYSLSDIRRDIKKEFGLIEETEKEWSQAFKEYEIFQCQFGILKTEYVFVSHRDYSFRNEDKEQWKTTFYQATRPHIFSSNWQTEYTGGTTVINTTFPELIDMVKEDCSQFQEDYDAPNPEADMDWGYREAEPQKTEEELVEEEVKNRKIYIRSLKYRVNELFTDLQKEKFTEFYGDVNNMTDDEAYNIAQQLAENDGIVDESLYEYFYSEYDLKYMRQ